MKNQIVINKQDMSTLTRIDITYRVFVKLECPESATGFFMFGAGGQYVRDKDQAFDIANNASRVLDYHGIEHEIVDNTNRRD